MMEGQVAQPLVGGMGGGGACNSDSQKSVHATKKAHKRWYSQCHTSCSSGSSHDFTTFMPLIGAIKLMRCTLIGQSSEQCGMLHAPYVSATNNDLYNEV